MEIIGIHSAKSRQQNNRAIAIRSSSSPLFSRELSRQEGRIINFDKLELDELRDKLQDAGDSLEREPTMANYRVYRERLGAFAKKATSLAYRIENISTSCASRPHEVVMVINKEADELYHLVMQRQQNPVRIASKIANIKGMIIKLSV